MKLEGLLEGGTVTGLEEKEMWDRLRRVEYEAGITGERVSNLTGDVKRVVAAVESLQTRVALIVGGIVVIGQAIPYLLRLLGK